jgi:hypothetical protein
MSKWSDVDTLSVNRDLISPDVNSKEYWQVVDSFTTNELITMTTWWLPRTRGILSGKDFDLAQGILYWHKENGFVTEKQHRWLINAIIANWSQLSIEHQSQVIF